MCVSMCLFVYLQFQRLVRAQMPTRQVLCKRANYVQSSRGAHTHTHTLE